MALNLLPFKQMGDEYKLEEYWIQISLAFPDWKVKRIKTKGEIAGIHNLVRFEKYKGKTRHKLGCQKYLARENPSRSETSRGGRNRDGIV